MYPKKTLLKILEKSEIYKMLPAQLAVRSLLVKKGIAYDKEPIASSTPSKTMSLTVWVVKVGHGKRIYRS